MRVWMTRLEKYMKAISGGDKTDSKIKPVGENISCQDVC